MFVSTDNTSCHEFATQFGLDFFYTRKTSKTSGKPGRQRQCLFQWPGTGIVASGAGRHGWATVPSNSDNMCGGGGDGDGGVCVCVCVRASARVCMRACLRACVRACVRACLRACVMCLQYTIIIFHPG